MAEKTCAHCGRTGRVRASVNGADVCHTDWTRGLSLTVQTDCYHLVTVYGELLGCRIPQEGR